MTVEHQPTCRHGCDCGASEVPAPEPSARLARAVATIWRDAALRYINGDPAGEFWKPVAHAMNLVLAALDGEIDPVRLGVDPEELRAALAAMPHEPELRSFSVEIPFGAEVTIVDNRVGWRLPDPEP